MTGLLVNQSDEQPGLSLMSGFFSLVSLVPKVVERLPETRGNGEVLGDVKVRWARLCWWACLALYVMVGVSTTVVVRTS